MHTYTLTYHIYKFYRLTNISHIVKCKSSYLTQIIQGIYKAQIEINITNEKKNNPWGIRPTPLQCPEWCSKLLTSFHQPNFESMIFSSEGTLSRVSIYNTKNRNVIRWTPHFLNLEITRAFQKSNCIGWRRGRGPFIWLWNHHTTPRLTSWRGRLEARQVFLVVGLRAGRARLVFEGLMNLVARRGL